MQVQVLVLVQVLAPVLALVLVLVLVLALVLAQVQVQVQVRVPVAALAAARAALPRAVAALAWAQEEVLAPGSLAAPFPAEPARAVTALAGSLTPPASRVAVLWLWAGPPAAPAAARPFQESAWAWALAGGVAP